MNRAGFSTHGAPVCADQLPGVLLTHNPPVEIESPIAALARTRNVIEAVFIARATPRRYHAALARHLRERPLMFAQHVRAAVLAYLSAPDEEVVFSRFDAVTDALRGFDPRVFM